MFTEKLVNSIALCENDNSECKFHDRQQEKQIWRAGQQYRVLWVESSEPAQGDCNEQKWSKNTYWNYEERKYRSIACNIAMEIVTYRIAIPLHNDWGLKKQWACQFVDIKGLCSVPMYKLYTNNMIPHIKSTPLNIKSALPVQHSVRQSLKVIFE